MLNSLKIEHKKTLREQISDFIRNEIEMGKLASGAKLPSTKQLSEQWGTQTANVHAALTQLVKEGLLIRKHGVGTTVARREAKLESVLIYDRRDFGNLSAMFQSELIRQIQNALSKLNINMRMVHKNQSNDTMRVIKEMVARNQIQAIILPQTDMTDQATFEKLRVPVSCLTSAKVRNRVFNDYKNLARNAVLGLTKQGVKRAGFMLSTDVALIKNDCGSRERHRFFKALLARAEEANIEVRDEWIYHFDVTDSDVALKHYDRLGFTGFKKIWSNSEKPDGLFVYTDDLVPGALMAMLAYRVAIPDDLKLVLYCNSGLRHLYPFPCVLLENDVKAMAEGLVKLIVDQYNGKRIHHINIEPHLIDNPMDDLFMDLPSFIDVPGSSRA